MSKQFSNFRQELNEYSVKQAKSDAGDAARGFASGITLGAAPYIEGGVKSLTKGTSFKKELNTAKAANAAAEKRSPTLYKGSEFASALVPGTGIAKGAAALVKGASAAKAAKSVAASTAVKSASDDIAKVGQKLLPAPKSKALAPIANKSVSSPKTGGALVPVGNVAKSAAPKTGLISKMAKPAAAAAVGGLALSGSSPVKGSVKSKSSDPVNRTQQATSSPQKSSSTSVPKSAAPIQKSLPRKSEADPNAGGGFVTARAYGSKKAGITSTENRFGTNKSTFMAPTPQGRVKPAETQSQKDTRLAAQGFKKF